jgi:hypothetical protein
MTKTLATDLSLRKLSTGNDDDAGCILYKDFRFEILNLGYWDLFEICFLVLEIFNTLV